MKTSNKLESLLKIALLMIAIMLYGMVEAQDKYKISGVIVDENNVPLCYANIALRNGTDSSIIAGTTSYEDGAFEIVNNNPGSYLLCVSYVGFLPTEKNVDIQGIESIDLGKITLQSNSIELKEATIKAGRIKAKQQLNNTTYYINTKMQKAASTGIDVIKYLPGIQVDLLHNISLDGSQNIIIQVNGVTRDASFLNHLNSDDIDKIEINDNPGVKHKAGVTGVINIKLKEHKVYGLSGHVYAEVPTRKNEVFSFPGASINYTFKKFTLYSSYDGEYSYFNIEAVDNKKIHTQSSSSEILNKQVLQQKNWSHKFHMGMDYFLNESNQFNLYGFINPYSNEHDGSIAFEEKIENAVVNSFQYNKDDTDKNRSFFFSVYYKHLFSNPQKELVFDMNYYNLNAQNSTFFSDDSKAWRNSINSKSYQNSFNSRLNYSTPLNADTELETGIQQSYSALGDHVSPLFNYTQIIIAPYALLTYSTQRFHLNGGMRIEYSAINALEEIDKTSISVLPNINMKYDLTHKSNLKFAIQKQISRPNIYQLNPTLNTIDPYTNQKGNPHLNPVIRHKASLDYATTFGNNFISTGVFFESASNVIETLTVLHDLSLFEKETQNLGNATYFGIKMLGRLQCHKNIMINPLVKFYHIQTSGNELATLNGIEDNNAFAFETGLSAIFSLKYDIALSAIIKYSSPIAHIQEQYSEDGLYFISIEKTFFENLKAGITSTIPFKQEFTYQRRKTAGNNFNETSEDNIIMSTFPIWFKLKYSFNSGKKVNRIKHVNDFKEPEKKKGF
jgi:hypothetical protein